MNAESEMQHGDGLGGEPTTATKEHRVVFGLTDHEASELQGALQDRAVEEEGLVCEGLESILLDQLGPEDDHGGWEILKSGEPAYTIAGYYPDNKQPYTTTVYTTGGPEKALDLAQQAVREDNQDADAEIEIVAIFEGEPSLVDFDAEEAV